MTSLKAKNAWSKLKSAAIAVARFAMRPGAIKVFPWALVAILGVSLKVQSAYYQDKILGLSVHVDAGGAKEQELVTVPVDTTEVRPINAEGVSLIPVEVPCVTVQAWEEPTSKPTRSGGVLQGSISGSLEGLQNAPESLLLARNQLRVEDIRVTVDSLLDLPTGHTSSVVVSSDRTLFHFPNSILAGPMIGIGPDGTEAGLALEWRAGRVGKLHMGCRGELTQGLRRGGLEGGIEASGSCSALWSIR